MYSESVGEKVYSTSVTLSLGLHGMERKINDSATIAKGKGCANENANACFYYIAIPRGESSTLKKHR